MVSLYLKRLVLSTPTHDIYSDTGGLQIGWESVVGAVYLTFNVSSGRTLSEECCFMLMKPIKTPQHSYYFECVPRSEVQRLLFKGCKYSPELA